MYKMVFLRVVSKDEEALLRNSATKTPKQTKNTKIPCKRPKLNVAQQRPMGFYLFFWLSLPLLLFLPTMTNSIHTRLMLLSLWDDRLLEHAEAIALSRSLVAHIEIGFEINVDRFFFLLCPSLLPSKKKKKKNGNGGGLGFETMGSQSQKEEKEGERTECPIERWYWWPLFNWIRIFYILRALGGPKTGEILFVAWSKKDEMPLSGTVWYCRLSSGHRQINSTLVWLNRSITSLRRGDSHKFCCQRFFLWD